MRLAQTLCRKVWSMSIVIIIIVVTITLEPAERYSNHPTGHALVVASTGHAFVKLLLPLRAMPLLMCYPRSEHSVKYFVRKISTSRGGRSLNKGRARRIIYVATRVGP